MSSKDLSPQAQGGATKAKHTEGTWERHGLKIRVKNRGTIAVIPTPQTEGVWECEGNTDLIAAAPELLEALKEFVRQMREDDARDAYPNTMAAAEAAIAKASRQSRRRGPER